MKNSTLYSPWTLVVIAFATALPARAQLTERADVSPTGAQVAAGAYEPSISADGRYVVFVSHAADLVPGDTNWCTDAFVRDRQAGVNFFVSLGPNGVQANSDSLHPVVSSDGRYVAFESLATNLVAGDTNGQHDVFVRDRQTGTTERVSIATLGTQADLGAQHPSISASGQFVAFEAAATNLVAGDTNAWVDVFVRDRQAGTTERVSVDSAGTQGDGYSWESAISADGRFVAFSSHSTNLVGGDYNQHADVFVHDRQTGATERVSVDSAGAEGDLESNAATLSSDGRFVAFRSSATNLVPGDTNGRSDIFVQDRLTGATERVSVDSSGAQSNMDSDHPAITFDGRYVAFESDASNLVPGDTNSACDVFVKDRQSGNTSVISVSTGGVLGDAISGEFQPIAISADGRFVSFTSSATNLVLGDTNTLYDVFVRDRGATGPVAYCTAGTTTHGCVPSITGIGVASVTASSGFTIRASSVEGLKQGVLFYGLTATSSPWASGSTSYRCVHPPVQRMGVQNSGGTFDQCNGVLAIDWNAYRATHPGALGHPFNVGQHLFAQGWFRDPAAPKTSNLSDGLDFFLLP